MTSNLANLTKTFQSMGLKEKQINHHELQIEYPVLDLLPADEPVTPFLRSPAYSGYREKPDPERYHLPLSGTDFTIRLLLPSTPLSTLSLEQDDLFITLSTLLTGPGRSVLKIATYIDPEDGDMYRFRLLTEMDGQLVVLVERELSSIAWEAERLAGRSKVWMKLIWRLLRRVSDRAYFHVHERLKNYRWHTKQVAEEQWDWKLEFDPKRFLAANLRVIAVAPAGKQYAVDVQEHDFDGEGGEGTFLLPCGHENDMCVEWLRSMSVRECLRLDCEDCGARVMAQDDGWRLWLLLHRERERRERGCAREVVWQRLANEFPVGAQQVSVGSAVLHTALKHAMLSILPPESASPLVLHMTRSDGFLKILNLFREKLEGDNVIITCASGSILDSLLETLDQAVGQAEATGHETGNLQHLPPGWMTLAHLWLTRATQLVGIPGYSGEDPIAVFGKQVIEVEDVDYDDTELDELEAMMRDARLE